MDWMLAGIAATVVAACGPLLMVDSIPTARLRALCTAPLPFGGAGIGGGAARAPSGLHDLMALRSSASVQHMTGHRIFTTSVASVYPHYVAKAQKKGRTQAEVDQIIRWLTGYAQEELEAQLQAKTDFETFFAKAPRPNPARALIKGVVCGVRVEEIEEPTMREIRYLDKLIDELAKGKAMERILRTPAV